MTGDMLSTKFNGLLTCRGRSVEHFKAYSLQHSYDITSYSVSHTVNEPLLEVSICIYDRALALCILSHMKHSFSPTEIKNNMPRSVQQHWQGLSEMLT